MKPQPVRPAADFFLKLWLAFCAACTLAGWTLSLLGALNTASYAFLAVVGLAATAWFWRRENATAQLAHRFAQFKSSACGSRRGLSRWLPRLWIVLAAGALAGGILHAPSNYDALTYRFPRLLNWLAEGRWYWIHSPDLRVNITACGFEWLMLPVFALTHSDRFFFLLNFIPFLLLPALFFSVARGLGARPRTAWHWMWLLPAGHCFLLQAGSLGNDAVAVVFLLASLHFALRAALEKNSAALAWSFVAAGLLTGVKTSNLPLLLPVAVALWPARRMFFSATAILSCALALALSFAPIAAMNQHFTGLWNGDPHNVELVKTSDPLTGVLGNSLQLAAQNLAPPVNPWAKKLNTELTARLASLWHERLARGFPRFNLSLADLPQEESAGLGLGLALLAALGVLAAVRARRGENFFSTSAQKNGWLVATGAWFALLFFMSQCGSESTARLVTPYYPLLLLPVLLLPGQAALTRNRCWLALTAAVNAAALIFLVVTPARPLWPARTICSSLAARHPDSRLLQRASSVYETYAHRADALASVREVFPATARRIGLLSFGDESDVALWRPFGERRVWRFTKDDAPDAPLRSGVEILVVQKSVFGAAAETRLEEIIIATGGRLLSRVNATLRVSTGAEEWCVIALPAAKKP